MKYISLFRKHKTLLFLLILALATFLRLYRLSSVPPGLNRDEAGFAYDTYSLLKTARDQHGKLLPLAFQSFGIWEYPIQYYLKLPFIALLGLNIFSARASVVFISLITIVLIFKLTQKWLKNTNLALLASFIATTSSWHFFSSRSGYSQNFYGLLFLLLGTYLLLFAKTPKKHLLGGLILGLTSFAYPAYFFFLPAFQLILLFVYWPNFKKNLHMRRGIIISFLVLVLAFVVFWTPNKQRVPGGAFFYENDVGIRYGWADRPTTQIISQGKQPNLLDKALNYSNFGLIYKVVTNYFVAFSPDFWVISGSSGVATVEGFGNILFYEPLLILLGIGVLFWKKDRVGLLLVAWILISPFASMLTKDPASNTKLLHMIVPLIILQAVGIHFIVSYIFSKLSKKLALTTILLLLAPIIFINIRFYNSYFRLMPFNAGRFWQVGYLDVVDLIQSYPDKNVYWNSKSDFGYIFVLFRTKYNPRKYQLQANRSDRPYNVVGVDSFDRYHFTDHTDWQNLCNDTNALYIDLSENLPSPDFPVDGELRYPGAYTFVYVTTTPEKCAESTPDNSVNLLR